MNELLYNPMHLRSYCGEGGRVVIFAFARAAAILMERLMEAQREYVCVEGTCAWQMSAPPYHSMSCSLPVSRTGDGVWQRGHLQTFALSPCHYRITLAALVPALKSRHSRELMVERCGRLKFSVFLRWWEVCEWVVRDALLHVDRPRVRS